MKIIIIICIAPLFAVAHSAPQEFSDPDNAERYRKLIAELRCLVCQNQNLADSNAELARDMREVVARMIREGKSDRAVTDFMTARYGDFVLYRPPLRPSTWALWGGPLALLLIAPPLFSPPRRTGSIRAANLCSRSCAAILRARP